MTVLRRNADLVLAPSVTEEDAPVTTDLDAALASNPDSFTAHNNLTAIALSRSQQNPVALDQAERNAFAALAIKPNDAVAANNMGIISARRGDADAAGRWFTEQDGSAGRKMLHDNGKYRRL